MAYTPTGSQWKMYTPDNMLRYEAVENQEIKDQLARAELYYKEFYSAPEILRRNSEYTDLSNSIEDRLNKIAELTLNGKLATPAEYKRLNNAQLLLDMAKFNRGKQKAAILSSLIQELNKAGDDIIFERMFNENDLNDVDEFTLRSHQNASVYQGMGRVLGTTELLTNPKNLGIIARGITAVESGSSYKDLLDNLENQDSNLSLALKDVRLRSGIADESLMEKRDRALFQGLVSALNHHIETERYSAGSSSGSASSSINTQSNAVAILNSLAEEHILDDATGEVHQSTVSSEVLKEKIQTAGFNLLSPTDAPDRNLQSDAIVATNKSLVYILTPDNGGRYKVSQIMSLSDFYKSPSNTNSDLKQQEGTNRKEFFGDTAVYTLTANNGSVYYWAIKTLESKNSANKVVRSFEVPIIGKKGSDGRYSPLSESDYLTIINAHEDRFYGISMEAFNQFNRDKVIAMLKERHLLKNSDSSLDSSNTEQAFILKTDSVTPKQGKKRLPMGPR